MLQVILSAVEAKRHRPLLLRPFLLRNEFFCAGWGVEGAGLSDVV